MSIPNYVAVDWGTSSFRLWVTERSGEVRAEHQSDLGMAALAPSDFETIFEQALTELGVAADTPAIICGMAGAAQGWVEAPYFDLPVTLTELPASAIRIPGPTRDIRIIPGLAQRDDSAPDVMRGEETLLLGAWLSECASGLLCLPGTHSKWARLEGGRVTRFSTAMTGELFGLLAGSSTLSAFVNPSEPDADDDAFEQAVREGANDPARVPNALFSVRAAPLLRGAGAGPSNGARLSGLLIGLEIAGMHGGADDRVTLVSSGVLARNYARAFRALGIEYRPIDADAMARAGLHHAARMIWPHIAGD